MAFKSKKLRVSQQAKVGVTMGYRRMVISISLPIRRIAEQSVRAAFGKKASIKIV